MVERKAPLSGGIETYIDMVEREMEGGVYVQFPLDLTDLQETGGLDEVEEEIDVHDPYD